MGDWQELAELWVRGRVRRREITPMTGRNQRSAVTRFARMLGGRQTIGPTDVQRWFEALDGLKASTIRSDFGAVRGWCRWLVQEGHIAKDPTFQMKGPREPRRVPRYLELEQVETVLAAAPDVRAQAMIWLGFGCGLRCCEIAALEVGDWNRRDRTLLVTGKGSHQREVPVPHQVADALNRYLSQYPATVGPLLRSYRDPAAGLKADTVSGLVSEIMRASGVKVASGDGVAAHALRHSCASDTLEASGGNIWLVAELLGHQRLDTVKVYLRRARSAEMRSAMDDREYPRAS